MARAVARATCRIQARRAAIKRAERVAEPGAGTYSSREPDRQTGSTSTHDVRHPSAVRLPSKW